MGRLTVESVDFARQHVRSFWDSDFFPKAFEYYALWSQWDEVRDYLTNTDIADQAVITPRMLPAPKPAGGYRVVHQLDPVNTLSYTAMAYLVASHVEAARPPIADRIACSYRIALDSSRGSFFGPANGYSTFIEKSRELAHANAVVLTTDITDFYNQIYLHRLQNNLAGAGVSPDLASDVEQFLIRLNDRVSHGVPVGPVASIIMAEATLLDVDQFLINHGVAHTRYADDFHIFGSSKGMLRELLQDLTQYLHASHRLVLATGKTRILSSEAFLQLVVDDPDETERQQLHRRIENLVTVGGYMPEDAAAALGASSTDRPETMCALIERVCTYDPLDLGLARHVLRRSRDYRIRSIVPLLLANFGKFGPVINDVVLYLSSVINPGFVERHGDELLAIMGSSEVLDERFVRMWLAHMICRNRSLLNDTRFRRWLARYGDVEHQAHAALIRNDVAWVRQQRPNMENCGRWQKRHVLRASLVLALDERRYWYRNLSENSPEGMDRWLLGWLASQPDGVEN